MFCKMWNQYALFDLVLTMCLHVVMVTLSVLATIAVLKGLRRCGLIEDQTHDDTTILRRFPSHASRNSKFGEIDAHLFGDENDETSKV